MPQDEKHRSPKQRKIPAAGVAKRDVTAVNNQQKTLGDLSGFDERIQYLMETVPPEEMPQLLQTLLGEIARYTDISDDHKNDILVRALAQMRSGDMRKVAGGLENTMNNIAVARDGRPIIEHLLNGTTPP